MPLRRINAQGAQARLHSSPRSATCAPDRAGATAGPVIVMIHGYKYQPGHARHCPHRHILAFGSADMHQRLPDWPRQLGFGTGNPREGLGIAFGWAARGAPLPFAQKAS